jgi:hypothetical protein
MTYGGIKPTRRYPPALRLTAAICFSNKSSCRADWRNKSVRI